MLVISVYIYGHNGLQKQPPSKRQGGVQWKVAQKKAIQNWYHITLSKIKQKHIYNNLKLIIN